MTTESCLIYKIENKINKKCYIGFTTDFEKRNKDHLRYCSYGQRSKLYNAIRKYGADGFKWDIIYISDDRKDTLEVMEQLFIDLYNSIDSGYNQKEGGRGGSQKGRVLPPKTPEECKKISERQIGRKWPQSTKDKISKGNKGKVRSKECIEKMITGRYKERSIKDPNGTIFYFLSIKDFCEEYNLGRPEISKLLRGKINQYKGWTIGLS